MKKTYGDPRPRTTPLEEDRESTSNSKIWIHQTSNVRLGSPKKSTWGGGQLIALRTNPAFLPGQTGIWGRNLPGGVMYQEIEFKWALVTPLASEFVESLD